MKDNEPVDIESATELAKRAYALGKMEDAVAFYATALEMMYATLLFSLCFGGYLVRYTGPRNTERTAMSPPIFSLRMERLYWKMQSLNRPFSRKRERATKTRLVGAPHMGFIGGGHDIFFLEEDQVFKTKASQFHFGGDEEEDGVDKVVDLKNDPLPEEEHEEESDEDEDDSPEDDFNAAWEVLDLSRAFYEKKDDEESRLKLADCYVALGDVSLETGQLKFESTGRGPLTGLQYALQKNLTKPSLTTHLL